MEQKIIVAAIVVAAFAYMLIRLRKNAVGKGCGSGCSCGHTKSCALKGHTPLTANANNANRKQQQ